MSVATYTVSQPKGHSLKFIILSVMGTILSQLNIADTQTFCFSLRSSLMPNTFFPSEPISSKWQHFPVKIFYVATLWYWPFTPASTEIKNVWSLASSPLHSYLRKKLTIITFINEIKFHYPFLFTNKGTGFQMCYTGEWIFNSSSSSWRIFKSNGNYICLKAVSWQSNDADFSSVAKCVVA